MAKSSAYRWQNERKRGFFAKPKTRNVKPARITNKQAKYLASLQRELGERYTGQSMTKVEATEAISHCLHRLGRKAKTPPKRGRQHPRAHGGGA